MKHADVITSHHSTKTQTVSAVTYRPQCFGAKIALNTQCARHTVYCSLDGDNDQMHWLSAVQHEYRNVKGFKKTKQNHIILYTQQQFMLIIISCIDA